MQEIAYRKGCHAMVTRAEPRSPNTKRSNHHLAAQPPEICPQAAARSSPAGSVPPCFASRNKQTSRAHFQVFVSNFFQLFPIFSSQMSQFPPSSPLVDSRREVDHPFAPKRLVFKEPEPIYPTPHPSSTTGTSSPTRCRSVEPKQNSDYSGIESKKNKDFNIIDPQDAVLRVPLVSGATHLTIGRSKQSSDFQVDCKNRTISRTHIKASYSEQQIVLQCLGFNGFAMRIPRPCLVFATNRKNDYILLENKGKVLDADRLEPATRKSVVLDANHTEFVVNRDETVTLPRLANILIEIRGSLVLLNPDDDNETDEETPVLVQLHHENHAAVAESTPLGTPLKPTPTTPAKSGFKITSEESTPLPAKSRPLTPLGDITNVHKSSNSTPKTPNLKKRRARSEEPQAKKKKKTIPSTIQDVEIDENSVKSLKNRAEIENVLTNHLAFSRLSSTPASFLLSISVLTGNLELIQLRTILHHVKCIGVIHREGKDAAGKPLEEEYYYMPENDDDKERPTLVQTIRGHGGLRACRRTHKQYFWKKPAPIKK